MTKKIKLIDRLKSWLVTLGIASVFGLAALGVNAANSYQKASAYEYQDNGTLVLSNSSVFDRNLYFDLWFGLINGTLDFDYNINISIDTLNDDDWKFSVEDYEDNDSYFRISLLSFNNIYANLDIPFDTQYPMTLTYELVNYDAEVFDYIYCLPSYEGYQTLRNYVLSYNAPQESGNFVTALTSFMSLIGGGIVQLAQSVGAGIVSFASGLFLDSGHLSILGGIIGIFCGIALAVGITSKVYTWVSTLGN